MNRNNILFISFMLLLMPSAIRSNVISPPEGNAIYKLEGLISLFITEHGSLPNSWQDMFQYDEGLLMLDGYIKGPENLGGLYSFIPQQDRHKFSDGQLVLIRYKPLPWPEVWKIQTSDFNKDELPPDKKIELSNTIARQDDIRYLIYRNKAGELRTEWWHESKVQSMIAQTGLVIPPPIPYKANISPNTAQVTIHRTSQETTELLKTRQDALQLHRMNSIWLIICITALIGILILLMIKKNRKQ